MGETREASFNPRIHRGESFLCRQLHVFNEIVSRLTLRKLLLLLTKNYCRIITNRPMIAPIKSIARSKNSYHDGNSIRIHVTTKCIR